MLFFLPENKDISIVNGFMSHPTLSYIFIRQKHQYFHFLMNNNLNTGKLVHSRLRYELIEKEKIKFIFTQDKFSAQFVVQMLFKFLFSTEFSSAFLVFLAVKLIKGEYTIQQKQNNKEDNVLKLSTVKSTPEITIK